MKSTVLILKTTAFIIKQWILSPGMLGLSLKLCCILSNPVVLRRKAPKLM
jgi:hypothetical protein